MLLKLIDVKFCQTMNAIMISLPSCIEKKRMCKGWQLSDGVRKSGRWLQFMHILYYMCSDFVRIDVNIQGNVYLHAFFIWIKCFCKIVWNLQSIIRRNIFLILLTVMHVCLWDKPCLKIGKVFLKNDRCPQSYPLNTYLYVLAIVTGYYEG